MFPEKMRAKGVISIVWIIILLSPLADVVDSDRDHQQPNADSRIDSEETIDEDTVLNFSCSYLSLICVQHVRMY